MGGLAMLGALVAGYLVGHAGTKAPFTRAGFLVIIVTVATGLIGLADDFIKVTRKRSSGLNKRAKFGAQLVVALGFALAAEHWAGVNTALSFTRYDSIGINLGSVGWVVFAVFVDGRHLERRQPHRRARRARIRIGDIRVRDPRDHRLLAVQALQHLSRALCARSRPGRRGARRRVPRIPVVERGTRQDHHGRHGLSGDRSRAWRRSACR